MPEPLKRGDTAIDLETTMRLCAIAFEVEGGVCRYYTDIPNNIAAKNRFLLTYGVERAEEKIVDRSRLYAEIQSKYGEELLDNAIYRLLKQRKEYSAYRVLSTPQVIFGLAMVAVLGAGAYFAPVQAMRIGFGLVQFVYVVMIAFKFYLSLHGSIEEILLTTRASSRGEKGDREWPSYTVLVPLYKEAGIVPQLVRGLSSLDYPLERTDILLLLEENDAETIAAVRAFELPPHIAALVVPHSYPKTKPKACNYGLEFARGEYLVIYDAEDIPEKDQLKTAVRAFEQNDPKYVCFQGMLNYYNTSENFLTRMFTLEYSYWFDYMLPGLFTLRLPIPLGGTSNHFRTGRLRELGGWDPFNTTEDADLGIRIASQGWEVGVIRSTTFEEANSRVRNFINQRTRWIKGYMQTYLVYMRHPIKLMKAIGFKGWLSFQLFVGGTPCVFLLNLFMYVLTAAALIFPSLITTGVMTPALAYLGLTNLVVGNFLAIYMNMLGAFRRKNYGLVLVAVLNPIYWVLHSLAAYRALWQLLVKPHYWDKTIHFSNKDTARMETVA